MLLSLCYYCKQIFVPPKIVYYWLLTSRNKQIYCLFCLYVDIGLVASTNKFPFSLDTKPEDAFIRTVFGISLTI